MTHAEGTRQFVHIAMGLFAFALRDLVWWQAAAAALCAIAFNIFLLPHVAGRLLRPSERHAVYVGGVVFYPLAVLLAIVAFPHRLDLAAAAWAILAAGDGAATLVGRAVGGPRVPWQPAKTWAGTAAFVIAGGCAGTLLLWWTRPAITPLPPDWFVWTAAWVAALVAGLAETLPIGLDDNLTVVAAAAAALWCVSTVDLESVRLTWPLVRDRIVTALPANGIAAAAGYRAGTVTGAGAWCGAGVGAVVWMGTGLPGWLFLVTCFLAAVAASRVGVARKLVLGIAEERGGRRGPGNTLANCGLAAVAALLVVWNGDPAVAMLVFVTALTTGASDTVASEIGKAYGSATRLVTTLGRVAPGTPGAISLEGTVAGVAAAFALGLVATLGLSLAPVAVLWVVVVAATAGSLVESVLGATFEASRILDNDMLNVVNTAVGAATAVLLVRMTT